MFQRLTTRAAGPVIALGVALAVSSAALALPSTPVQAVEAPARTPSVFVQRSHHRIATPDEMTLFYREMERAGWPGAEIALVPTEYTRTGSAVIPEHLQFATYFGDVDGDGQPEWVVGCHFRAEPVPVPGPDGAAGATAAMRLHDNRARVVLFKKERGHWRADWRSPGLGYEFCEPSFNRWEVENGLDRLENLRVPLSLIDVDGDGRLEIAYHCRGEAPMQGAMPGIYRYDGQRWVAIAPQGDRFSLQDVDRDGRLEVITGSRRIGQGMGDDDVPRVWRWNGRQYQDTSREFPRFYADLAARYTAYVQQMEERGVDFNREVWERAIQKASSLSG